MLTEHGGIECEMTVTRMSDDRFYLNSAIAGSTHDLDWLQQHVLPDEDVAIEDRTDQMGILAVTGPLARDVLAACTDADLSSDAWPWLTCQQVEIGGVGCIALRVSYVGELGWEIHHPIDQMPQLYDALVAAGQPHGMVHFGSSAMNVMRMEKAYKAWGGELTTEITPIEARLERFVDLDSGRDFLGRDATLARRQQEGDAGIDMVLVYCEVDATDSDCRGNEPCYDPTDDGSRCMGITTGGAWGHTVDRSLAFAYVDPAFESPGSTFEITLFGQRHTATVLDGPAHDPANERLRA
jgi:dimethylglycine dehydrogenase